MKSGSGGYGMAPLDRINRYMDDEEYWRGRSDETRQVADCMADPTVRDILIDVSNSYARLANHAARRKHIAERMEAVDERLKHEPTVTLIRGRDKDKEPA